MKSFIAAVLLGLILCGARSAQAHAFLEESTPKVGATVTTAPAEVMIHFDDDIQADKSNIQVFDAGGNEIDKKDSHPPADLKDKATLTVSLPALKPGSYKVTWHALCPDSHKTEGTFQFTFRPPG